MTHNVEKDAGPGTYRIYFTQTASCSVEVEADDLESAVDLAYEQVPIGVCAHCSGWGGRVGIDLGGEWEADDGGHWLNGEFVDTSVIPSEGTQP